MIQISILCFDFDSWRHIQGAHLAGKHSSWVHICAIEYWQLVTTCIYTNLSQINIINRIFLYYRSLPCVTYINCGPKRDSNHRRQMTLLMKQTIYRPSHHGWFLLSIITRSGEVEMWGGVDNSVFRLCKVSNIIVCTKILTDYVHGNNWYSLVMV